MTLGAVGLIRRRWSLLRFFFEIGVSHTPLWPDGIEGRYGPYEQSCRSARPPGPELTWLCEWFESSIDRKYPQGS
ncbi:hypothetical protein SAMN06272781_3711 [Streptomyces sp. 1222.2]|uniref:hypothetical protein n=1 Tax=Streptomyces sp. 1222.2 TaxID=1938833 RepID=UPI000BC6C766|nr:hypothetical protein [Streptomyces sp. 1222.2]SOD75893.1 hypothetical protein SAMN06272781_3711 [Streptomyces sp. 1222.2]